MEDEWKPSEYCKIYQEMNKSTIDMISSHCNFRSSKRYSYKKRFFEVNSIASESDYYVWQSHFHSGDWQGDIWPMSAIDFKYSWPYHASLIEHFGVD